MQTCDGDVWETNDCLRSRRWTAIGSIHRSATLTFLGQRLIANALAVCSPGAGLVSHTYVQPLSGIGVAVPMTPPI